MSSYQAVARRHAGLTLVEMLVAMVATLLLVAGMVEAFKSVADSIAGGRAAIEVDGQIRGVSRRLHSDLEGITASVRPWPAAGSGQGYFEYVEGAANDYSNVSVDNTLIGDYDDILAFTARSTGTPFVGRALNRVTVQPAMTTSQVAEIVWWNTLENKPATPPNTTWDPEEDFILRRRVLLIRPDLDLTGMGVGAAFFANYDISARYEATLGKMVANSLADLALRQNRFAHQTAGTPPTSTFPHTIQLATNGLLNPAFNLSGDREGDDVIITHVLAFDVQVYDPLVPLRTDTAGEETFTPSDSGFAAMTTTVGFGAFVDLEYRYRPTNLTTTLTSSTWFSDRPLSRSQMRSTSAVANDHAVYDTWPLFYERDGVNQDFVASNPQPWRNTLDQGSNGLDDNGANGVDDATERETEPPYARPLRGIRVRIRVLEHDSRLVRQVSVVKNFIPE